MQARIFCFLLVFFGEVCFAGDKDELSEDLFRAWTHAYESESEGSRRVARFSGHIEGALNISVPSIWQPLTTEDRISQVNERGFEVCTRSIEGNGSIIVYRGESPSGVDIHKVDQQNKIAWSTVIFDLFPEVDLQGSGQVRGTIVPSGDRIYFFFRLGEIRGLVVIRRIDGKVIGHFAFIDSLNKNLAKQQPYNQKLK
jgi:hypothetical protein